MKRLLAGSEGAHENATANSDGQDYNGNIMRPGSFYIGSRNDDFRYIDKDGTEQWIVQCSTYIADETILRGEAVSISSRNQISLESATSDLPFVHKTDADHDPSCLGLAMNYAEKGQLVHVQNHGTFKFRTIADKDTTYSDGKTKYSERELLLDASYRSVRGQRLFVAKHVKEEDATDVMPAMPRGRFSFDFIDSVYRAKNTIQIGYLTDAPLDAASHTQEVWVELEVTGDTRGPLEHTQYLVELGEPFTVTKEDQFRLFAIGQKRAEKASFTIKMSSESIAALKTFAEIDGQCAFIGIRRCGDRSIANSVMIPVGRSFELNDVLECTANPLDIGYVRAMTDHFFDGSNPMTRESVEQSITSPITISNGSNDTEALNAIANGIESALQNAFEGIVFSAIGDSATSSVKINAANDGGYFEVYLSEKLIEAGISLKVGSHGSLDTLGKAIVADCRSEERSNVIGVYCGGGIGTHPAGETITLMKLGTFTLTAKQTCREVSSYIKNSDELTEDDYTFKQGANYYLGINGGVFRDFTHLYYDRIVKIGQQIGPNEAGGRIFVDIGDVTKAYDSALPLGYVKPSVGGQAEYGFFVMDGETPHSKDDFQDIYRFLLSTYPKKDIEIYDESGKETPNFKVPRCHSFINGAEVPSQMKYLPNAMFNGQIELLPSLRFGGKIENGKISDCDITRLIQYGTLEDGMVAPSLDNVDVRLYIRHAIGASETAWREIDKGYHLYNNTTLYGYDWEVAENNERFTLKMHTEDGLGVAMLSGSSAPKSMEGKDYMVVITRRTIWKKQYQDIRDIGSTFITKSMDLDVENLAPSVKAIKDYYKEKVETNSLKVGSAIKSDKNGTKITGEFEAETLTVEGELKAHNPATNSTERCLFGSDMKAHEDKTIDSDTIHGIKNTGIDGNINARKLEGIGLGNSSGTVKTNLSESNAYVPYVADGKMSVGHTIEFGGQGNHATERYSFGDDIATKTIDAKKPLKLVINLGNNVQKIINITKNSISIDGSTVVGAIECTGNIACENGIGKFNVLNAKTIKVNDQEVGALINARVQDAIDGDVISGIIQEKVGAAMDEYTRNQATEPKSKLYIFESYSADGQKFYGSGLARTIDSDKDGFTKIRVISNHAVDPNAEDFANQQFYIISSAQPNSENLYELLDDNMSETGIAVKVFVD